MVELFTNFTWYNFIVQLVGIIATLFSIFSFQGKNRFRILIFQCVGTFVWCIHFALLKSTSGMALNVVCLIRTITFIFKGKWKFVDSFICPIIFCLASIVVGIISWESAISILPMIGCIFSTIALYQTKEKNLRLFSLGSDPLWLVYDGISGSIGGVITEIFCIISIVIALYRFRQKKENPNQIDEINKKSC